MLQNYENIKSIKVESNCHNNKAFNFQDINTERGIAFYRSGIVKDAIKNALKNNMRALAYKSSRTAYEAEQKYSKWVMEYMNSRYVECGFKLVQQQQEQVLWDHRRIMRYLKAEQRACLKNEITGVVKIAGNDYEVTPDLVFETNKDTVEMVYIKNGKPFSDNPRKPVAIEMMLLYATIKMAQQKGYKNIKASYYFLKKSEDVSTWAQCSTNFFGSNIIQLGMMYGEQLNEARFAPIIELMEQGIAPEQMDTKKCLMCPHWDICKYELPPISVETQETSEEKAMEEDFPKIIYSDEQQKVIDADKGIIRVIAAAGSGKTQTVAGRVKKLLETTKPENILCITFSDAGVKEMRRKIERMVGPVAEELKIVTFHSLNYEICKDQYVELGFKRPLTVIDEVQKYSIINKLMKKFPIYEWTGKSFMNYGITTQGGSNGALAIVDNIFSQIKTKNLDWETITAVDIDYDFTEIPAKAVDKLIKLYGKFDEMCKLKGLISFDDMETYAEKVLIDNPDYLSETYSFEHIIIDEFQDTSEGQMELVKRLKEIKSYKSLMIVGDDAQAIYEFRGTTPKYIINFQDEINENLADGTPVRQDSVKDLFLTKNFRSKQAILDYSSNILTLNEDQIQKSIIAYREGDATIDTNGFCSLDEEYGWIADKIAEMHENGKKYEDIAILAYKKAELRKIANALTEKGIPSMFGAPQPLIENSRIRATLAFARVIKNSNDTKDAAIVANAVYKTEEDCTTPFMELSGTEVSRRVQEIVDEAKAINVETLAKAKSRFLALVEKISLQDEAVLKFAEQFENKDINEILQYCQDFDDFGLNQQYRSLEEYPGVKLLTIHSSKGLEWENVFLSLNGYRNKKLTKREKEEVRRLLFVAMTRARDYLSVSGQYFDAFSQGTLYGASGKIVENAVLKEVLDVNQIPWHAESEMYESIAKKAKELAEKKKAEKFATLKAKKNKRK